MRNIGDIVFCLILAISGLYYAVWPRLHTPGPSHKHRLMAPIQYSPSLSYNAQGVAGVFAASEAEAYYGMGQLHARHRQAQALQVWSAGQGILSTSGLGAIPQSPTYALDEAAHRIDAPRLGQEAWQALGSPQREHLQAYVDGFLVEGQRVGRPWEKAALGLLPLHKVTPAAVLSGALLMAYHSQAQSQGRMDQLLLQLLQGGASPGALRALHAPYLDGWRPESFPDHAASFAKLGASVGAEPHKPSVGGSNAWAIDGAHSASGSALLYGDPHLPVGELPPSVFELRVALPHGQYWLGGTVPGLPAMVVGRNQTLAWSNTHACAKATDSCLLHVNREAEVVVPQGVWPLVERRITLGPKWAPWARRTLSLWQSP